MNNLVQPVPPLSQQAFQQQQPRTDLVDQLLNNSPTESPPPKKCANQKDGSFFANLQNKICEFQKGRNNNVGSSANCADAKNSANLPKMCPIGPIMELLNGQDKEKKPCENNCEGCPSKSAKPSLNLSSSNIKQKKVEKITKQESVDHDNLDENGDPYLPLFK